MHDGRVISQIGFHLVLDGRYHFRDMLAGFDSRRVAQRAAVQIGQNFMGAVQGHDMFVIEVGRLCFQPRGVMSWANKC